MRDTLRTLLQDSILFRLGLYSVAFGFAPFYFLALAIATLNN